MWLEELNSKARIYERLMTVARSRTDYGFTPEQTVSTCLTNSGSTSPGGTDGTLCGRESGRLTQKDWQVLQTWEQGLPSWPGLSRGTDGLV